MAAMTTAIIIGATAMAAATAYSADRQASAAKKAAAAQEKVGMANIEAALKAPQLAADAAKSKLKAKQASATQTILTAPGGMQTTEENVNQKSILGV
jgi:ribosomal protein S11